MFIIGTRLSILTSDRRHKTNPGFTIVELLIVIVVIAILATLVVVAYNGISKLAAISTLKSDLQQAQKDLEIKKTTSGSYPTGSSGTQFDSSVNTEYTSDGDSYCMTLSSAQAQTSYYIDGLDQAITEGTCPGHTGYVASTGGGSGSNIIGVASGWYHNCPLTTDGSLYCWGFNAYGQFGNGLTNDTELPLAISPTGALAGKTLSTIVADTYHTCALATDGKAYCWGSNSGGQHGNGTYDDSALPTTVSTSGVLAGKTLSKISTNYTLTCAVATDGRAYCWGDGYGGGLGNGTSGSSNLPVAVTTSGVLNGKTLSNITNGYHRTCVLSTEGRAYCWGDGTYGELGNGSDGLSNVPVAVSTSGVLAGKTLTSISASSSTTCALDTNGGIYCWGWGGEGQLGNGSYSNSNVPVTVNTSGALAGKTVLSISGTCALTTDGDVYCWGYNPNGQIGNGTISNSAVPVAVSTSGVLGGKNIKYIVASSYHTCAVDTNDSIYCWGQNIYGELGSYDFSESTIPVAIPAFP